jgi:hypothetical protein
MSLWMGSPRPMNILRKIWEGSPDRDIAGLRVLLVPVLLMVGGVWMWRSILKAAGYTLFPLLVSALALVGWGITKQISKRKISASVSVSVIAILLTSLACGYGIHLYKNYVKIQSELREKASWLVRPRLDDESVSEVGYVYDMRRETYIRESRLNLVWFIVVPSENTRWSCSYEAGFPDFKVGDGVTIIHKKTEIDPDDYTGYVIGLHDKEQGKATRVWALDEDQLEMDLYEEGSE